MDYKTSGVDIEAGYKSVELMKKHIAKTMRPEVLGGIGGFSGAFSMEKFKENDKNLPGMLILESEKYALDDNLKKIEELEQKGVIIVFGCLEDPKNIEKNQELQDFLGIYKIVSKKTELTGAKLFEGLLLGGEVIYETPEDKDERDRQDLQLNVP